MNEAELLRPLSAEAKASKLWMMNPIVDDIVLVPGRASENGRRTERKRVDKCMIVSGMGAGGRVVDGWDAIRFQLEANSHLKYIPNS
jgi:hypothetical protein